MLVGFVYPAYASWKALESRPREASAGEGASTQGRDAWLTYWVAFSFFNVVEHVLDWLVYWRVPRRVQCCACSCTAAREGPRLYLLRTLTRAATQAQDTAVLRDEAVLCHLAAGAANEGAQQRAKFKRTALRTRPCIAPFLLLLAGRNRPSRAVHYAAHAQAREHH